MIRIPNDQRLHGKEKKPSHGLYSRPLERRNAPYLTEVPDLPLRIAELAAMPNLKPEEEQLVQSHIDKIRRQVREARDRWYAQETDIEEAADELDDEELWWIEFETFIEACESSLRSS